MEKIKGYIINHKFILLGALSINKYAVYIKYFKDNIAMITDLFSKMSSLNSENGTNSDKVMKFLEGPAVTNLIIKILEEVKINCEESFKLKDLNDKIISETGKITKTNLYEIFKDLSIINFYSSIFITRILLILTQTNLKR